MWDKLRSLVNWMHNRGIALPLLRDTTGQPSVSLTMLVISFVFCLVGLFQKLNSTDLDIDMSQSLTLFGVCASLYFGRRLSDLSTSSSDNIQSQPTTTTVDVSINKNEGNQ